MRPNTTNVAAVDLQDRWPRQSPAEVRWHRGLEQWHVAVRPAGPGGRVIVELADDVRVHVDRLSLGTVLLVELDAEPDGSSRPQATRLIADLVGAAGADLIARRTPGTITVEHRRSWLAGLAAAWVHRHPYRHLWSAEAAAHSSDGPQAIAALSGDLAARAAGAVTAICRSLPRRSRLLADQQARDEFAMIAATVAALVPDIAGPVAELAATVRAPDFAPEPLPFAPVRERVPELRLGGEAQPGVLPPELIRCALPIVDRVTWRRRGNAAVVEVKLKIPGEYAVALSARSIRDGAVVERISVSFDEEGNGVAVLPLLEGEFEIDLVSDPYSSPLTAHDRLTRRARGTAAHAVDATRQALRDARSLGDMTPLANATTALGSARSAWAKLGDDSHVDELDALVDAINTIVESEDWVALDTLSDVLGPASSIPVLQRLLAVDLTSLEPTPQLFDALCEAAATSELIAAGTAAFDESLERGDHTAAMRIAERLVYLGLGAPEPTRLRTAFDYIAAGGR